MTGAEMGGYPGMLLAPVTLGTSLVVFVVLGAIVGAPIGALRASPDPGLGAVEAALGAVRTDLGPQLHAMLRERVVILGQERASRALRPLPDQGPSAVVERVDYRGLAAQGIATVLEVRIVGLGLIGHEATRSFPSCFLGTRTRLVRTSDRETLYESTVGYVGPGRPLDEWVADGGARLREEVQAAVGWAAEQIVDQVFLRVAPPEGVLRIRVRPATLGDLETRLLGNDGLLRGPRRFDAEFEGLALRAEEGTRLRALLPEIARAPRDSELTLEGTVDEAPFTIKVEKNDRGRVSGSLEGLVFDHPGEARDFVESFVPGGSTAKLTLDGYAVGRRIRVTLGPGGVALDDRGAGLPERQAEKTDPGDALEVRVLPATLEDVRTKLLGERGLVTRGRRFEAEFEDLALAVEDVEPLVDLLRAALQAPLRSELELDGTLEGLPFKATLFKDREGRARLALEGLVFASDAEVDQFLTRFEDAGGLLELTLVGSVAGQKLRRTWRPGNLGPAPARSP